MFVWLTPEVTWIAHSPGGTAATHGSSGEDECVHPLDAHCRADNSSDSKKNSGCSDIDWTLIEEGGAVR